MTLGELLRMGAQYFRDAMPGGSLNPEAQPVADRANYIGGLLDPQSQISQDAQNWHKRTQIGLADQLAGRETPEAEAAYQSMMTMAGIAPFGITKAVAPQAEALRLAQQRAALPVEQYGLGLPANNTPQMRADAMFPVDAYHGTADNISKIDPKMFGSATGAQSAKDAFWATSSPSTAEGYAYYAANSAPIRNLLQQANEMEKLAHRSKTPDVYWSKYDDLVRQAEELEAAIQENRLNGQTVMPLRIDPSKAKQIDAKGAEFVDMEGGVNNFLKQAKREKKSVAVLKNLADDVGFSGRPTDHFGIFNPDAVRSRFAAFDPWRRNAAIAAAMGVAAPDLLARENHETNAQPWKPGEYKLRDLIAP